MSVMEPLFLDRVDSTNLEVRRIVENSSEPMARCCVVAREQDAGIGRDGRRWESPAGGLWMSMAFRTRHGIGVYTPLPLLAGLSLCEVLEEECSISPRIKWPNDVLVSDRKLAGILCQSFQHRGDQWIVIGVGVNGNYPASRFTEKLRVEPTTLLDQTSHEQDIEALGSCLYSRFSEAFDVFEGTGIAPFLESALARLAWIGRRVTAENTEAGTPVEGTIEGIDERGRLLLRVDTKTRAFASGELSKMAANQ